jgi:hypothetical protein
MKRVLFLSFGFALAACGGPASEVAPAAVVTAPVLTPTTETPPAVPPVVVVEPPPTENPPAEDPPTAPPAEDPPADDPLAEDPPATPPTPDPCAHAHDRSVDVANASALAAALAAATPGTRIRLAPGTYSGRFRALADGTADKPIVLCGPRTAILDGGVIETGYVLHLDGASHWTVAGFTVMRGKNGIMLDHAHHNVLTGLRVHGPGQTAFHVRRFSSDNLIERSEVQDTGRYQPGIGEAVYIGSAYSNWESATGSSSTPDRADRNRVIANVFGPGVTSEAVDLKEGTTGGEVRGNTFLGADHSGINASDSWMDVKGNRYVIADNVGTDTYLDGFQTHEVVDGWGDDNVFSGNVANVNANGYGFRIDGDTRGNVVLCDNVVHGAVLGLANVTCALSAPVPEPVDPVDPADPIVPELPGLELPALSGLEAPSQNLDLSRWYLTLPSGSTVSVAQLNAGYQYADVFYTDPVTGGMVFRCPNLAGTTTNSSYSRTELREMLNPSNTSAKDDSNNWTTADGGTLRALLRVDHVSTTGDDGKVGRVIIGQIHGADSEPIRLYFHKKPGEAKGRIYAAHDTASNSGSFGPDIVGNAGGSGILLGETFSYEIKLVDITLTVKIVTASGTFNYTKIIDSAYRGENLYFKAGVYNQNNTGDSADYVQATFFALTHAHP